MNQMISQPVIPLRELSRIVPGSPSTTTIRRWATRGIHGVRLQSWRIGGRRFSTELAVMEFLEKLNPPAA
jgi:hypothetical protein